MTHPARWSPEILRAIVPALVDLKLPVHDPFAGTGERLGVVCNQLRLPFTGTEIEPEFIVDPRVEVGDSTSPDTYPATSFVVCTSPCLVHGQRVLTDDLRWVPVEDVETGDRLMAFDESGQGLTSAGRTPRRRWRITEVTRSVAELAECVHIHLANGESITCTPNHPWLADRYASGGNQWYAQGQWVEAQSLMHQPAVHHRSNPTGWWVHRQLDPWTTPDTYDAGWLAGIFDGEGCLTPASGKTALKLGITQNSGPVLDRIQALLKEFGFTTALYWHEREGRTPTGNVDIQGGRPAVMRLLGQFRPQRLLDKWMQQIDIGCTNSPKIQVVAVEPAGRRWIQGITTTTGTYIGEGYLHHNTYPSGMTDHFKPKDTSRRHTYRQGLAEIIGEDRPLHPQNMGRYGVRAGKTATDKHFTIAWQALVNWPADVIVNVSDFDHDNQRYRLVERWRNMLGWRGYEIKDLLEVPTRRQRFGANRDRRAETETVIIGHRA